VRLKGGDPFVFGRGGEEALALAGAGIPYEVVPGVSSAVAAPAYAGVPVTHRGLVTSFTVVAGHGRSVDAPPSEGGTNWEALAAAGGTIIVLMGVAHRAAIARRLIQGGLPPSTPVAAVRWGTEPQQQTARTTLSQLGQVPLSPPVTMVIGAVAGLDLAWYESRPLLGRRVVVTRASHQASELGQRLRQLGAAVLEAPVIAMTAPADGGAGLRRSAGEVSAGGPFGWVAFTSANAVHRFFEHVPDTRALGGVKLAAVGPATAGALRTYRAEPDLVPDEQSAHGLVLAFPSGPGPAGANAVLLPQAAGAGPALADGLRGKGWEPVVVEAYRTVPHALAEDVLALARAADAICFASSSAVASFIDQAGPGGVPPVVVCIGPATARTARSRGLEVTAEAAEHSAAGLVATLASVLASAPGAPPVA
jgi:uroporphyrinogen III methyltransferase/synthase